MTFFVICFGLIALISWKCWVDDQIWRKWHARQFQEDFEATTMERYEQFEVTVRDMINAQRRHPTIALPDHPALPTRLRPSCQMQCDCIRSLPRDRRSEITWRRLPRRGFCAALPVRSDFRSEIDDAAAEHGASESEANRQKKLAEHSSVRSCYDLPEWHALCLLAGQPWHQRRRGGTLPGGSSQELSQRESPRPQTVEWRRDVRLNGTR